LIERWNGIEWTIEKSPNPHPVFGNDYLTGVACASATSCSAVGYSDGGNNGPSGSIAEQWNGSSWTAVPTPSPAGSTSTKLTGVACAAPSSCEGVGYSVANGGESTLVEHWDGTGWGIEQSPRPADSTASTLQGVSCTGPGACTAVGHSNGALGDTQTLAERLNGTTWSDQVTPNRTNVVASALSADNCAASSSCEAVGDVLGSAPLSGSWDGTSWHLQFPPTPPLQGGLMQGIDCTNTTNCLAVGFSIDASAIEHLLAERWDGKSWQILSTRTPTSADNSRFAGVACATLKDCMAAGYYVDASTGAFRSLVEHWDGTVWKIEPTPNPSDDSRLAAVSCPAVSACFAVGRSFSNAKSVTLAERWDGNSWTLQPTPNPSGASASALAGVACVSRSDCTAVGQYNTSRGTTETLAERWSGAAWTVRSTPNPAASIRSLLSAVACPVSGACISVGTWSRSDGTQVSLSLRLSGSTWSILDTPNPAGAVATNLSGISCTGASTCTAVGTSLVPGHFEAALAERLS
jgi:hypothetical protein